jgi:hypothetical protein
MYIPIPPAHILMAMTLMTLGFFPSMVTRVLGTKDQNADMLAKASISATSFLCGIMVIAAFGGLDKLGAGIFASAMYPFVAWLGYQVYELFTGEAAHED